MSRGGKTLIIAEAGVNHNGSAELALRMVDAAAEAGADYVKFQTFKTEDLSTKLAEKAAYQKATTGEQDSQFEMLEKLELSQADFKKLIQHCKTRKIDFLSTPFDLGSARLLIDDLGLEMIKVASGELDNAPLLLEIGRSGRKCILSTGMSSLTDVEFALSVLAYGYSGASKAPNQNSFREAYLDPGIRQTVAARVSLMHCSSDYPAKMETLNLKAIQTLRAAFGLPTGYSDHSMGLVISLAAVAVGASSIEKHFTLDRSMKGPDHAASLEPSELKEVIRGIREIEKALGDGVKIPSLAEHSNSRVMRKSLVATTAIAKGEAFTQQNLTVKRPATGVSCRYYFDYLGKKADRDYSANELIQV